MRPPPNLAGRPPGSKNPLTRGAIQAIRSLRYRVPVGTPEPVGVLADEALATVANVMLHAGRGSMSRLAAAKLMREEACGPIAQRFEHSGPGGGPIEVTDAKTRLAAKLRAPSGSRETS